MAIQIIAVQTDSAHSLLVATALRRKLSAELRTFTELFSSHPQMDDQMTDLIKSWHSHFLSVLHSSADEQTILQEFKGLLKEILIDPMPTTHSPLEEESFLGSDGETYGYKALCVYLSQMDPEYEGHSPFRPDLGPSFKVEPHPIVTKAIQWLKQHDEILSPHPAIERSYEELRQTGNVPHIPTAEFIRLRERVLLLAKRQEQVKANRAEEAMRRAAVAEQARRERVAEIFKTIHAQIAESTREHSERRESILKRNEGVVAEIEQEKITAQNRIVTLHRRIDALKGDLKGLEEGVSQLRRDEKELQLAVAETSQMIAERDAKRSSHLEGVLISIVAAAVLRFAFPLLNAAPPPTGAPGLMGGGTWTW